MLMIVSLIFLLYGSCWGEVIIAKTDLGVIRGVDTLKTRLGFQFYAFRGIRYAEAPIENSRFRNPIPVAPWKPNVFDATNDGPICPQATTDLNSISEDCLRLNVYSKNLTSSNPVVVYLHPGGFYFGSSQSYNFAGPEHLMDRDIVLVTLNYRLGSLGFLATDTEDAPGNAGLKDQVIALRWIRDHIKNFGGDPNSVTLLGYSAGSLSIGLHMVSPMSKDLFHRAIAMSASPLGQWTYDNKDLSLAKRQAKLMGCKQEPMEDMISCLKKKPMTEFASTMRDMFEFNWNPILNWLPVVENDFGQERFLIENPYKSIQDGRVYRVPLITGITEFEFISAAFNDLKNDTTRKRFNEDFETYAPIAFLYERNSTRSHKISSILKDKYLKNATLTFPDSLDALGKLYSDSVIGFEYHRFLQLISHFVPVYTYLFTYRGRYSHFQYPANKTYGAVHHDELLYLLRVPFMTPPFKVSDPENDTIDRLTRIVFEFAKKSDPNNYKDEYLGEMKWNLYSEKEKEYMEIGQDLIPRKGGIYLERYKIWDDLFPIPHF